MRQNRSVLPAWIATAALVALLAGPSSARAGKLSWLDDVVREVVREAEAGGKAVARGGDDLGRAGGRLFVRESADEGLEIVARRADTIARATRAGEAPAEALLRSRFSRLLKAEPETARAFEALAPAEKRLVVEMGETARRLAIRYPGRAEPMIRELGTDGLSAVRVFGDDVAETLAKEGPSSLGVLRKTGRGGWEFFTTQVLPHKKKLAAAGVLTLFLADPDRFVDVAGRATEYAVRKFAEAGVTLASAVGNGTARGLASLLSSWGLGSTAARIAGVVIAVLVVTASLMVLIGAPIRWAFAPFARLGRLLFGRKPKAATR